MIKEYRPQKLKFASPKLKKDLSNFELQNLKFASEETFPNIETTEGG